jgi:PqqD family protein of HPr-rel-A system
MRWRSVPDPLLVREWDGQSVVYNRKSGDTHCLDRTAHAVISCLSGDRELDLAAICGAIVYSGGDRVQDRDDVSDALDQLERLGLVRRASE